MRTTRSRLTLVAVGLVVALAATGCSSDDENVQQGESASAPSGSLCGSIPGEGPRSLGAMSTVTATEAIAQSQLLTTLNSASAGAEVASTLEARVRQLEEQLRRTERERDLLTKALAMFSPATCRRPTCRSVRGTMATATPARGAPCRSR